MRWVGKARLVLVGGGHAHVEVLRAFGRRPQPGVCITLISRQRDTPYSGMLPGVIAGHFTRRESHIALAPLAAFACATFLVDEAGGVDLSGRLVHRRDGPSVPWDVLSLDIGSTPDTGMTRVAPEAVAVKPIDGLLSRWDSLRETLRAEEGSSTVAVIGAGAAGVELVLSMQFHLQSVLDAHRRSRLRFALFSATPSILPGHSHDVQRRFMRVLAARGVTLHLDERVLAVRDGQVMTERGSYAADHAVWATQATAAPWIRESGLSVDAAGFMQVSETLESVSHADVFGAGDVATIEGHARPKSGVYAVREGPPLARNLGARLAGRPRERYRPQPRALSRITSGDRYAIASRARWSAEGRWVWWWKGLIDRRFMRRYEVGR
jgi:selenide,water dikinase